MAPCNTHKDHKQLISAKRESEILFDIIFNKENKLGFKYHSTSLNIGYSSCTQRELATEYVCQGLSAELLPPGPLCIILAVVSMVASKLATCLRCVRITSFVWWIKMVALILYLIPNSASNISHVREERIVFLCLLIDILGFDDVHSPCNGKFNSSGLAWKCNSHGGLLFAVNPMLANKKGRG